MGLVCQSQAGGGPADTSSGCGPTLRRQASPWLLTFQALSSHSARVVLFLPSVPYAEASAHLAQRPGRTAALQLRTQCLPGHIRALARGLPLLSSC